MSPDSSYCPPSSSTTTGVLREATSVLMVAPSSSTGTSPSAMLAPLNLQKYDRNIGGGGINKPTAIATAVIRVQVPECNSSVLMHHLSHRNSSATPPPAPQMLPMPSSSVPVTSAGNVSHSTFMVPPPSAAYSNVIVMNKKPKVQQPTTSRSHSPDYGKSSYPVMEPTVASTFKGEPELNIGTSLKCTVGVKRWPIRITKE